MNDITTSYTYMPNLTRHNPRLYQHHVGITKTYKTFFSDYAIILMGDNPSKLRIGENRNEKN